MCVVPSFIQNWRNFADLCFCIFRQKQFLLGGFKGLLCLFLVLLPLLLISSTEFFFKERKWLNPLTHPLSSLHLGSSGRDWNRLEVFGQTPGQWASMSCLLTTPASSMPLYHDFPALTVLSYFICILFNLNFSKVGLTL